MPNIIASSRMIRLIPTTVGAMNKPYDVWLLIGKCIIVEGLEFVANKDEFELLACSPIPYASVVVTESILLSALPVNVVITKYAC